MSDTKSVNHYNEMGNVIQAMADVNATMDSYGLDRKLHHLIQLRASQINECGFCVKMHTKEARDDEETNERLDRVIVWNHVNDFTDAEKAALEWTEALTKLNEKTPLAPLRAKLRNYYSDQQISVITGVIAMINTWNRIHISNH